MGTFTPHFLSIPVMTKPRLLKINVCMAFLMPNYRTKKTPKFTTLTPDKHGTHASRNTILQPIKTRLYIPLPVLQLHTGNKETESDTNKYSVKEHVSCKHLLILLVQSSLLLHRQLLRQTFF
jgi:hypothetical protein